MGIQMLETSLAGSKCLATLGTKWPVPLLIRMRDGRPVFCVQEDHALTSTWHHGCQTVAGGSWCCFHWTWQQKKEQEAAMIISLNRFAKQLRDNTDPPVQLTCFAEQWNEMDMLSASEKGSDWTNREGIGMWGVLYFKEGLGWLKMWAMVWRVGPACLGKPKEG